MLALAIIYLILWVALAIFYPEWSTPAWRGRLILVVMLGIIGYVLFWGKLGG